MPQWISLPLTVLFSFWLTACFSTPEQPLRLGTNLWSGYEPLYLAREKGFYDKHMIRLVEYSSTSQVLQAFRNELIDAAAVTLDEAMLLLENGEDIKIILVTDVSNGADVILGKPDIKNMQDLKGKRIGVEATALGSYIITRALQIHKIDSNSIKVVNFNADKHESAYKQDEIDAIVTFEPVRSKLLTEGAKQIFSSADIPGEIIDLLIIRTSKIDDYAEHIEHLADGWFRALTHLTNNPENASITMSKRMKLSPDETLTTFEGLSLPGKNVNNTLLFSANSPVRNTAKTLKEIMLKENLLTKQVDTSKLFLDKPLYKN